MADRTRLAVLAAVLVLLGSGWYQAFTTPAYYSVDEPNHVGYVLEVQRGDLVPDVDTPIRARDGGPALQQRVTSLNPYQRVLYVAKSPPWPYLLAAGPAAATRALGLESGPLLGVRLTNLLCCAAAVAFAFVLGKELSGGSALVGLVTAATTACFPYLGFAGALAMIDGMALLATTATLALLARLCRSGPSRGTVIALGLAVAAGAGVRSMSLLLCGVAAAVALAVVVKRRTVHPLWAAAWLGLPAAVTSGWYYGLNQVRYGDPTASAYLVEEHQRRSGGSLVHTLTDVDRWRSILEVVVLRRTNAASIHESSVMFAGLWLALGLGALAVAVVLVLGVVRPSLLGRLSHRLHPTGSGQPAGPSALAWLAMGILGAATLAIVAKHVANGGNPQVRYLMPILPVLAAAVALAVVAIAGRWGGAALVVAVGVVQVAQLRPLAERLSSGPPRGVPLMPLGPDWVRLAGLGVAGVAAAVVLAAILWPRST